MNPSQVIVGGDESVRLWLHDRFGIDTNQMLDADIVFRMSRTRALTMTVEFFVGADDLAAFPDPDRVKAER